MGSDVMRNCSRDAETAASGSELMIDILDKISGDVFCHLLNSGVDGWRALFHCFQEMRPLLHLLAMGHRPVALAFESATAEVPIPQGGLRLPVGAGCFRCTAFDGCWGWAAAAIAPAQLFQAATAMKG